MSNTELRIEKWKKRLLDLGKRNRLINYRETKRSNIKIITPDLEELFSKLVISEKILAFPYSSRDDFDDSGFSPELSTGMIEKGDITTDRTIKEQQKTLRNLRSKAKTAIEEQGVNILYLSMGFLHWTESENSNQIIISPIVLVPVTLTVESITSPFKIGLHEDEIVINPTLVYKLENDYGIKLPDIDNYENNIITFLNTIEELVSRNNWSVACEVGLSLLSFLKISMHKDLSENKDKLEKNPLIKAISGDLSETSSFPADLNNYDHDKLTKPIDVFQVLDADSSQQDAILFAKKGISYVLQGPPGTGKSQTITNIIAESLADGKKVLFVSEKMAALEVVQKRLSQAGISDFCLTLHSHKANKKEVLQELGKTLHLSKFVINGEASLQLTHLQNIRSQLNEYASQLHQKRLPLGKTIYEVNGALAKLRSYPDLIFQIKNVADTTEEKFVEYKILLHDYARIIGRMSEDYTANPWNNSTVSMVTHELRHDIETNLRRLLPRLGNIAELAYSILANLEWKIKPSFDFINELIEILNISSGSPRIPETWIYGGEISLLTNETIKLKNLFDEHCKLFSELSALYDQGYFELDANKISQLIFESLLASKKFLNTAYYNDEPKIIDSLEDILAKLRKCSDGLESIKIINSRIQDQLCLQPGISFEIADSLQTLVKSLLHNPKPTDEWFSPEKYCLVKRLYQDALSKNTESQIAKERLLSRFDPDILTIDYLPILKRFKTDYGSIFKFFNRNYWKDTKTIKACSKEINLKISDQEIVSILGDLRTISDTKQWFSENNHLFLSLFGSHYDGEITNWKEFGNAINTFDKIQAFFGLSGINAKIRGFLLSEGNEKNVLAQLYQQLALLQEINVASILQQVLHFNEDLGKIEFTVLQAGLFRCISLLKILFESYNSIKMFGKQKNSIQKDLENIIKLARLQTIVSEINSKQELLHSQYEFLYKGIDTDWDLILADLSWANDFQKLHLIYNFSASFISHICTNNQSISATRDAHQKIKNTYADITNEWLWFLNLFKDQAELTSCEIFTLIDRIEKCEKNLSLLEEWIDYRNIREKCQKAGLENLIIKCEEENLSRDLVFPTFSKRFYRLWLDAKMPEVPMVSSFRRRTQDDRVQEFSKLDTLQFMIATSRLKHKLISQLPDFDNQFTSSKDEVGILKRELSKQRRIMPLRQLFKAIPNLLLKMKPCLMMSPLTVSLFLSANDYNFDVIIFDEASQVRTEDAVGSIIRGNQVVIAGDRHQLPPTNFFMTTTSSDENYDPEFSDEDDQYNDTEAYESILDEAVTVLPERTLRWHYRSRHEHLIAFSNKEIYKYELITFPSSIERLQDNGVEYIRVENGVYDRSGKRDNRNEAKKVAELVFRHFRKYPKRSLGVVTFSEAQQQTVESELRLMRLKDQSLEEFFSEDKEESFFIKNLENVQGDERDTIILSIGYAKDAQGIMHMNFGPLSRDGGYRRLNVAITRAKFNVKLVGSILPSDLKLSDATPKGVQLLKSFIEYAIHGPEIFKSEIKSTDQINLESPFEESVYAFLVNHGYEVATQVGCSDYRIDLAIKHPTLHGKFVLGVECDGAMYHSTRTARERDRLRQSVLEDMGWKIYRIWSTDWVKDPVTEGNNLLGKIEALIASYVGTDLVDSPDQNFKTELSVNNLHYDIEIPISQKVPQIIDPANPYEFRIYEIADIHQVSRRAGNGALDFRERVIAYVIEKEGPIHIDVLCKRVASIFGYQRVTSDVQASVSYAIYSKLRNNFYLEGSFCWKKGSGVTVPRIPGPGGEVRKVDYIATEELAEALYAIAGKSIGIMLTDLFDAAARTFGFNRTTERVSEAMQTALELLERNNRIKNNEGKITTL